jgi:hypothetical protein
MREEASKLFSEISRRATESCQSLAATNKRVWCGCSLGMLYLLYRSFRYLAQFEQHDPKNLISRIIFVSVVCLTWLRTRTNDRDIRLGSKLKHLQEMTLASFKKMGSKRKVDGPKRAFRTQFQYRGGNL